MKVYLNLEGSNIPSNTTLTCMYAVDEAIGSKVTTVAEDGSIDLPENASGLLIAYPYGQAEEFNTRINKYYTNGWQSLEGTDQVTISALGADYLNMIQNTIQRHRQIQRSDSASIKLFREYTNVMGQARFLDGAEIQPMDLRIKENGLIRF